MGSPKGGGGPKGGPKISRFLFLFPVQKFALFCFLWIVVLVQGLGPLKVCVWASVPNPSLLSVAAVIVVTTKSLHSLDETALDESD